MTTKAGAEACFVHARTKNIITYCKSCDPFQTNNIPRLYALPPQNNLSCIAIKAKHLRISSRVITQNRLTGQCVEESEPRYTGSIILTNQKQSEGGILNR